MIEFFNTLIEAFFWFLVFWFAFQILGSMFHKRVQARLEELDAEIEDIKRVYKRVKIEQHHDMFYLFNADTDEFIAQGRTMQDIRERVREDIVLNIMEGDPDVIQRFRNTAPQTDPV